MSPIGTLWCFIRQRQSKVILSVAALNGLELHMAPFTFPNKSEEFMEKFPLGKIPAFEGVDGFKLIEGAPIARYLSEIGTEINLLGHNVKETALIDQWAHYAEHEIGGPILSAAGLVYGYGPTFNRGALDKHHEQLARGLKYLESFLGSRSSSYIASDSLSLADLMMAGAIYQASRIALGVSERAQYPAIFAYYETVTADERIKEYWGTEEFVDEPLTKPTKRPYE